MSISTNNNNNKIKEQSIEPEEDLIKFQNSLDESINLAKDLVNSWLPKNLDSSWDLPSNSSSNNSFDSTTFSAKARPPRLGLGANVTKYHIQQAEDTKLRNKLLSNGSKKRSREEELLPIKKSSTVVGEDSESESEDSRSNSFKKINGNSTSDTIITNGKKSIKNNNVKNNNNSIPSSSTSLFNPATPTKSSPASAQPTPPSQLLKKTIAPISFYASVVPPSSIASTSSISSIPSHLNGTSTLTKNQRKKERDKAKLRETKKLRLEESRAADLNEELEGGRIFETEEEGGVGEEEEQSRDSSVSPTPPSPRLKDHLKKRLVKPPFAPSDSSSGTEEIFSKPLRPVVIVKEVVENGNKSDDDEDEEIVKEVQINGDGEKKSKKRRRNKKKKSTTEEGGESKSLLNLEARPAVESSP